VAAISLLAAAAPGLASAQALTPPKGEGSVSVVTSAFLVTDHLGGAGQHDKVGDIRSHSMLVDVTYGVTDRVALTFSVPWVSSKYSGIRPHPNTTVDNGQYYSTFQDLSFALRYNLARGPAWITPFIATGLPSHEYAYYGHAAAGRRLKELQIGVGVAKVLDPWLPRAFVQGRYAFGFAQEVQGHRPNRSYIDVEGGYFVTQSLRAFGMVTSHFGHGGVTFPPSGPRGLGPALFPYHDRIGDEAMVNVGGGLGLSASDSIDLFGSLVTTTWGRNGHALNYGLNLGVTWTFKKGVRAAEAMASRPEGSLWKCACQKQARF
jgi:hypothetical protein